jgi:hypothetical protein
MKAFDKKMAPLMKPLPKVDKAAEALEIQNLMSRRMFYHSVGRNELKLASAPRRWAPKAARSRARR